jgi:N-acetylglucosaminyldiphosphoundecaprenol N-acetyl-beta-D-mannosaminyltransferase
MFASRETIHTRIDGQSTGELAHSGDYPAHRPPAAETSPARARGSNQSEPNQSSLFGLPVDAITMMQAVARCVEAVEQDEYFTVGVVNAAKIVAMKKNAALRQAVTDCDMILADGQSVVWASRMLRSALPERVAGIDLFLELLAVASRRSYRVYFLGARQEVLERMLSEVRSRYPQISIAGFRNGYFNADEEEMVAADIYEAKADLLFIAMSSPKKELFLRNWGEKTGVCVVHGVGGSFDILAGETRRAPIWYQRHGLEWLYRARQEPIRLGRRYLTTNLAFIRLVAGEYIRLRRPAR